MKEMHFLILGSPQSKANSRMLVRGKTKTGKSYTRSIKSQQARQYEESCLTQLSKQKGRRKPLRGSLAVEMTIWYKTKLNDLDPSIILDCMQKAEIYDNDRQIIEQHLFKNWDKENPRAEVLVYEL